MTKICLVFIFNHRFDKNIPKLEHIYQNRFSNIFHLVPFYDGEKENVIPVFENSFYFQGYIPQSFHVLSKHNFSHYFFVGDDVLLHPAINENNIFDFLSIDNETAFFPDLWGTLTDRSYSWANTFPALNAFYQNDFLFHHAVKWKKEFPSYESTLQRFKDLGLNIGKFHKKNFTKNPAFPSRKKMKIHFWKLLLKKRRSAPYPLVSGYSDIFLIPSKELPEFSRLCEITRQMRLWVEVAIPTIAVSTIEKIVFEKNIRKKGTTYWKGINEKELVSREGKCDLSLNRLFESFEKNELYIHPIKLSKWEIDL